MSSTIHQDALRLQSQLAKPAELALDSQTLTPIQDVSGTVDRRDTAQEQFNCAVIVENGLHMMPCGLVADIATKHKVTIKLKRLDQEGEATAVPDSHFNSVVSIACLGAECKVPLRITITGGQSSEAKAALLRTGLISESAPS